MGLGTRYSLGFVCRLFTLTWLLTSACHGANAPNPAFSAQWRSEIVLPALSWTTPLNQETNTQGLLTFEMNQGESIHALSNLRLTGRTLTIGRLQYTRRYEQIISRTSEKREIVIDVPDGFENFRPKFKKVSQAIDIPPVTFENLGISVQSRVNASPLKIELPSLVSLKNNGKWVTQNADAMNQEIASSIDAVTDNMLNEHFEVVPLNVVEPIATLLKWKIEQEKVTIFKSIRTRLKEEISASDFWAKLIAQLPDQTGEFTQAELSLGETSRLRLGDSPDTDLESGLDFVINLNQKALSLLQKQGHKFLKTTVEDPSFTANDEGFVYQVANAEESLAIKASLSGVVTLQCKGTIQRIVFPVTGEKSLSLSLQAQGKANHLLGAGHMIIVAADGTESIPFTAKIGANEKGRLQSVAILIGKDSVSPPAGVAAFNLIPRAVRQSLVQLAVDGKLRTGQDALAKSISKKVIFAIRPDSNGELNLIALGLSQKGD